MKTIRTLKRLIKLMGDQRIVCAKLKREVHKFSIETDSKIAGLRYERIRKYSEDAIAIKQAIETLRNTTQR